MDGSGIHRSTYSRFSVIPYSSSFTGANESSFADCYRIVEKERKKLLPGMLGEGDSQNSKWKQEHSCKSSLRALETR